MDGLKSALGSDPECGPTCALSFRQGKVHKKTLETLLQQLLEKAMRDQDLGGGGYRAGLECQRFALRLLLNSVLDENVGMHETTST